MKKISVGLYERAPNALGLQVGLLKIKVVALSVRCSQTTHSFLDFGQGRVGDSVLSSLPLSPSLPLLYTREARRRHKILPLTIIE